MNNLHIYSFLTLVFLAVVFAAHLCCVIASRFLLSPCLSFFYCFMVLTPEIQYEGNKFLSISSLVVDEKKTRPVGDFPFFEVSALSSNETVNFAVVRQKNACAQLCTVELICLNASQSACYNLLLIL